MSKKGKRKAGQRKILPKGSSLDSIGRTLVRCKTCNQFAPHSGFPLCGSCSRKKHKRTHEALVKAIMAANDLVTYEQACQLAKMIEDHGKAESKPSEVKPGSGRASVMERAERCGEYKLTFGQWSGSRLKDVSPDYIIWLSELVESKKHSIDFLNAIRAARAIRSSWQTFDENAEVPFDVT